MTIDASDYLIASIDNRKLRRWIFHHVLISGAAVVFMSLFLLLVFSVPITLPPAFLYAFQGLAVASAIWAVVFPTSQARQFTGYSSALRIRNGELLIGHPLRGVSMNASAVSGIEVRRMAHLQTLGLDKGIGLKLDDAKSLRIRRRTRASTAKMNESAIKVHFVIPDVFSLTPADIAKCLQATIHELSRKLVPVEEVTRRGRKPILAPIAQGSQMEDSGSRRLNDPKPIVCVMCGYDLRAQSQDAHCPECGVSVRRSLHGIGFQHMNPAWTQSVRRGAALLALGSLALSFLAGEKILTGGAISRGVLPFNRQALFLFEAAVLLSMWIGVSLFTRLPLPDRMLSAATRCRRFARYFPNVSIILFGVMVIGMSRGRHFELLFAAGVLFSGLLLLGHLLHLWELVPDLLWRQWTKVGVAVFSAYLGTGVVILGVFLFHNPKPRAGAPPNTTQPARASSGIAQPNVQWLVRGITLVPGAAFATCMAGFWLTTRRLLPREGETEENLQSLSNRIEIS